MARKRGKCRICRKNTLLDPHHIISQHHARTRNQKDLITNKGNIVYICRKCHNQTPASKSRYKMIMEGKEKKVEAIEIEKLKAEITRMKAENRIKIRNIRELAKKEIEDNSELKNIDITILELENEVLEEEKYELKNDIDILNSLSLEYHISEEITKTVKKVKKKINKTKKGVEKEIKKEVKNSIKVAKKAGKKLRKRTGL